MEGKLLKGKYKIEREIARGGMSTVYLCTNIELGNKWAAKHIERKYANIIYEEEILKKLYHISLPKVVDICRDDSGIFIIQSYIEGISLARLMSDIGSPGIDKSIDYMLQLCEVLSYLHNMKPKAIIHKDLKPSNIIITEDGKLVLIDFGIAVEQGSDTGGIRAATNVYAPPEQLALGGICDARGDIYSLGVILTQLIMKAISKEMQAARRYKATNFEKRLLEIGRKCTTFLPEDRYQKVDGIAQDLADTRNKLIAAKESKKVKLKLAQYAVAILSFVEYVILLIGIIIF